MNKIFKFILMTFLVVGSSSAMAAYPGFDSGVICNGYPTVIGVVDLYTPTQTYKSDYGVYIRLKDSNGRSYGGVIYQRSATEYAYKQLTSVAMISLMTKVEVKMCYSGSYVYALELRG